LGQSLILGIKLSLGLIRIRKKKYVRNSRQCENHRSDSSASQMERAAAARGRMAGATFRQGLRVRKTSDPMDLPTSSRRRPLQGNREPEIICRPHSEVSSLSSTDELNWLVHSLSIIEAFRESITLGEV
jgi:hypothetical protein